MPEARTEDVGTRTSHRSAWNWALWVPIVVPLLTPLFNFDGPRLLGFPFFYWFQLVCAVLSMVTIAVVHRLTGKNG